MRGASTLLFVGDRHALQPTHRSTLRHLVDLLAASGVEFGLLGDDEPSTGRVALDIGDEERFDRQAQRVASAIRESGATTVLCADALDFNALRAHVPKVVDLGGVEIVHAVELLDEMVGEGRLTPRQPLIARVAYHDPATLGRLSEPYRSWSGQIRKQLGQLVVYDPPRHVNRGTYGVYDPPRRLLEAIPGVELVEFERRREYAFACGDEGVLERRGIMRTSSATPRCTAWRRRARSAPRSSPRPAPAARTTSAPSRTSFSIRVANVIDLLHASIAGPR